MRRREFVTLLGSAALCRPPAARAQQKALPVIGFLSSQSPETYARFAAAFRQGLSESGYVEGRNVGIEYRWAESRPEALPGLAADLVRRQVTVIAATGGLASARAAEGATTTIPIVFNLGGNPVEAGLVASFNRPGGNATGVVWFSHELFGKRLGMVHELVPAATVIGFLINPNDVEALSQPKGSGNAARALGCRLVDVKASTPSEIEAAFAALAQQHAGALIVDNGAFFIGRRTQIVALAAQYAIPTMHSVRGAVKEGGLIYYGNDLTDAYRRNARYVGRILKGDHPGDLPIDRSSKFELLINLKTAKALGLTVPQSILARADEVIE